MRIFNLRRKNKILISKKIIQNKINTDYIGKNILILAKTNSTNTLAKNAVSLSAANGSVFIAENQTAGRGRLGRSWISSGKDNIAMSVLLYPSDKLERNLSLMTLVCGLAVSDAIDEVTNFKSQLKWPNDILINYKKICGILCEYFHKNGKNCLVIGIGVNVNNRRFDSNLSKKATSLYIEYKRSFAREEIIANIINNLEELYDKMCKGITTEIIEKYKSKCVSLGENVEFTKNSKKLNGIIKDISMQGELVVDVAGTKILSLNSIENINQKIY